ncbi:MAG: hypothetical protein R3A47_10375 [Polyangiales bacterium]
MSDLLDVTKSFPWGLHDSVLVAVQVDYARNHAAIHVLLMMDERQTRAKLACIDVHRLLYFVAEPPSSPQSFVIDPESNGVTIDVGRVQDLAELPAHLPNTPHNYWSNWIFVNDYNAFIYLCAQDASFRWVEENEREVDGKVLFAGDSIPDPK